MDTNSMHNLLIKIKIIIIMVWMVLMVWILKVRQKEWCLKPIFH